MNAGPSSGGSESNGKDATGASVTSTQRRSGKGCKGELDRKLWESRGGQVPAGTAGPLLVSLYTACSRPELHWAPELLFVSIGHPVLPTRTRAFLRLLLQLGSLQQGLCPSLGAGGLVASHVSVWLGGGDLFGWAWWASDI